MNSFASIRLVYRSRISGSTRRSRSRGDDCEHGVPGGADALPARRVVGRRIELPGTLPHRAVHAPWTVVGGTRDPRVPESLRAVLRAGTLVLPTRYRSQV